MKRTESKSVLKMDVETLFNDADYEDCPEIVQIKRFERLDNDLHNVCGGACEGCDFDIEEEDGFTKKQLLSFIKLFKTTRKGNKTK